MRSLFVVIEELAKGAGMRTIAKTSGIYMIGRVVAVVVLKIHFFVKLECNLLFFYFVFVLATVGVPIGDDSHLHTLCFELVINVVG